jgi:hypothetical protein
MGRIVCAVIDAFVFCVDKAMGIDYSFFFRMLFHFIISCYENCVDSFH